VKTDISQYHARIGRRGGLVSSPAKRAAARRNALKRWGRKPQPEPIPLRRLRDGEWYLGQGRNSSVGLWDKQAQCFWTIAVNDFPDPASFPGGSRRQVRLKQVNYRTPEAGSFAPISVLKNS
jgi:hypothetical protein